MTTFQDHPPVVISRLCTLVDQDELRTTFSLAMSAMYKAEVPLYGDLVRIVQEVNKHLKEGMAVGERLDLERHGAIRLGTPDELGTVRRIFAQLGLHPVDYYDLSVAGLPMHATAFRPVDPQSLSKNPFRVFATLLRPELLSSRPRELALRLLRRRQIFSHELMELLDIAEEQRGFAPDQAEQFIIEALRTFKWQPVAAATYEEYQTLAAEHPILADIASFQSAHINHLTPRTLDIEETARKMRRDGLAVKARIEGPPARKNPVLLRQTSFLALSEQVNFPSAQSIGLVRSSHRARFGEVEQRGAALTPKGRDLYNVILAEGLQRMRSSKEDEVSETLFREAFGKFPDDWQALVRNGLVFFECRISGEYRLREEKGKLQRGAPITRLLDDGVVEAKPITYEDFLPLSAAGIFRSNLSSATDRKPSFPVSGDRDGLEAALGLPIVESSSLYTTLQSRSLSKCAGTLGICEITIMDQGTGGRGGSSMNGL